MKEYDIIIVGGGPGGLTAGMYGARSMLKTLIIERYLPGGQVANTELIEDYPGFESISGAELATRMSEHAKKFGAEIISEKYNIVILDEINVAVKLQLIPVERVLELIESRPEEVTLVLTGRAADPQIVKAADLVTEMLDIKHPYQLGILAMKGIDY